MVKKVRNLIKEIKLPSTTDDIDIPDAFTPAYIEIMLLEEQAEALGDLTADDTDVEIAVTEGIDKATDSRSVFEVAVQLVEEAS